MDKKLIPYSVYLPADYVKKLKVLAKERKASELIRNAVMMIIDAHGAYTAGYNQGLDDASQGHLRLSRGSDGGSQRQRPWCLFE
jgi:predicted transcriptional regulator